MIRKAVKLAALFGLIVWIMLGAAILPFLVIALVVARGGDKAAPGALLAIWVAGFWFLWHELMRDPLEPRGDWRGCKHCLRPIEKGSRRAYCDEGCKQDAARLRRTKDDRAMLHDSYGDIPY